MEDAVRSLPLDIEPREFVEAQASPNPPVLVDCREEWEYELVRLPNAVLIPLGTLAARVDEVPRTGQVVVYCHHGVRSRRAATILRGAGITNAQSLAGGIDEWSATIDPTLPRY